MDGCSMIQRSLIRKISAKRLRQLGGRVPLSSIRRGPSKRQKARLAELAEIRERWWREHRRMCGICHKEIFTRQAYTLDHIEPGSAKSDAESNLQPAHWICNLIKGSKRNFTL